MGVAGCGIVRCGDKIGLIDPQLHFLSLLAQSLESTRSQATKYTQPSVLSTTGYCFQNRNLYCNVSGYWENPSILGYVLYWVGALDLSSSLLPS